MPSRDATQYCSMVATIVQSPMSPNVCLRRNPIVFLCLQTRFHQIMWKHSYFPLSILIGTYLLLGISNVCIRQGMPDAFSEISDGNTLTFNSIVWIFCRMWGQEAFGRGRTLSNMGVWKTSFGPSTLILTAVLGGLFQLTTGLSTNILCDAEVQTSVCLQVRLS